MELNSQSLHENQLIPGLVQDLQSLRLKLDTSVKRNEMLSEKYLEKLEVEATKGTSKGSKVETREFATNTDLTVSIYQNLLRVAQTQVILFLKSMSERRGSEI